MTSFQPEASAQAPWTSTMCWICVVMVVSLVVGFWDPSLRSVAPAEGHSNLSKSLPRLPGCFRRVRCRPNGDQEQVGGGRGEPADQPEDVRAAEGPDERAGV